MILPARTFAMEQPLHLKKELLPLSRNEAMGDKNIYPSLAYTALEGKIDNDSEKWKRFEIPVFV